MRNQLRQAASLLIILASLAFADDAEKSPSPLSLSKGIIQFTPPPDPYVLSFVSPDGQQARYTLPGLGSIQLWAIPNGAPPRQAEDLAKSNILDLLRGSRNKSKEKEKDLEVIKPLAFETDDRFFCTLHEQFRKGGNTFDQTHIYRNLAPHQLIVNAIGLADPPDNIDNLRKTAQTLAQTAALVPKGQKPPPAPTLSTAAAASEDAPPKPDLAAAQKDLEAATAKVEADLLKDPNYKSAKSKADAAESKLKQLRDQQPPNRAAIAAASEDWLDAKRPVESLRQAALAKDPAVIEARKKLADARRSGSAGRQP